jgi:predicted nucleic acid-binding Zn ribbon protein
MPDADCERNGRGSSKYLRHQAPKREPQRIGEVLSQLLSRRGYAQERNSAELQQQWRQAVGEAVAQHSRPGNLGRGVLQIIVRNSATLQELTFRKRELLAALQKQGRATVRDLRFRVGEVD